MKRNEFISELKEALENNLDPQKVKEHVEYYDDYIRNEMKNNRSEEDVVNELGDPWAIAKTIRLSEDMNGQETAYTHEEHPSTEKKSGLNLKTIAIIAVIAILAISLLSVAMGLLGLAIRYAVPILLIVIVIKFLKRK